MKKKLLFVTQDQFGYHIDAFEHAKWLKNLYDITFYCWDYDEPKIALDGVNIIYCSRKGNLIKRNLDFRLGLLKLMRQSFNLVFLKYYVGVSLAHLAGRNKVLICDVRTATVYGSFARRLLLDTITRIELWTFRHRTVISHGVAERLQINRYHLLPLGANPVYFTKKQFDEFNLLYVGTLTFRKVEDSIRGFGLFYQKYKDRIKCRYTIIGTGIDSELAKMKAYIHEFGLEEVVTMTGYITHNELPPFLERANIGVSYIPVTSFFNHQPPTKSYEYLLSGMVVIATATQANRELINPQNGVLVQDTEEDFAQGLAQLYEMRGAYDAVAIQQDAEQYTWEKVVLENLYLYFSSLNADKRK